MEEAMSGEIGTEEAALRIFPTPAMILIDVDGSLPPAKLGPKGAKLAAQAIRRMGLTGSIGMLPSASLDKDNKGLYEPSHGSAPDIAGKGIANPLATILSAAMMLRFSLNQTEAADRIESAVRSVLSAGLRTADIWSEGTKKVSTREMGDAVVAAVRATSAKTITTITKS